MTLFIDTGYIGFNLGYSSQFGHDWRMFTDKLYESGAVFCMDSRSSIRRETYPWYKAQRPYLAPRVLELQKIAHVIQDGIRSRYDKVHEARGLEADDLIAHMSVEDDVIMGEDKDFLQLPGRSFVDRKYMFWGFPRVQKKLKSNISTPDRFLAYQLLYGDVADNIPRRISSKDKDTANWVFNHEKPLAAVVRLLPPKVVRESLNCLLLPTPLWFGHDAIETVLERYGDI